MQKNALPIPPYSINLQLLPIETVPVIGPKIKNQLAFVVEVSALPVDQRL